MRRSLAMRLEGRFAGGGRQTVGRGSCILKSIKREAFGKSSGMDDFFADRRHGKPAGQAHSHREESISHASVGRSMFWMIAAAQFGKMKQENLHAT